MYRFATPNITNSSQTNKTHSISHLLKQRIMTHRTNGFRKTILPSWSNISLGDITPDY